MSDPTRYRVANNQAQLTLGGNILAVDPFGPLVDYIDYARLKAEVEAQAKRWAKSEDLISHYKQQMDEVINNCQCSRLKADVNELADGLKLASEVGIKIADEVTRLKAEVERLNTGIQPEGSNDAVGRAVNVLLEKENEIASLKAEVERLRYVGDGMAVMVGHIEVTGDAHRMMLELSKEWEAAKEGKV